MNYLKFLQNKKTFLYIFCAILVIYIISWQTKFTIAMTIFGVPLLLYFPGKLVIELFPPLCFGFGKFGKFSLSVLYSFCWACVIGRVFQRLFGFNTDYQFMGIILSNVAICLAYYLLPLGRFWKNIPALKKKSLEHSYVVNWDDFIPLIILAGIIVITLAMNPLAQNLDNYLILLKQSIIDNVYHANPTQLVQSSRQSFISFLALENKFLGLNIAVVFRETFTLLFFVWTLTFYDYLKRNFKSKRTILFLYLSLLIPPVILTDINTIMPQVVIIAVTIPVLLLAIESIKNNNTFAAIIGLMVSMIALTFHELGAILILIALISLIINLVKLTFFEKKISWKHIVIFLIIIFPYLKLYNVFSIFNQTFSVVQYLSHFIGNIQFKWWFINSYSDVGGTVLSWVGINALFYYLFNGLLLIIFLIFLVGFLIKTRVKVGIYILPPLVYFILFLSFAEILPRFGVFFLPSRAWVYLVIGAVFLLALFFEQLEKRNLKIKYFPVIMTALIVIGCGGSLYVIKHNVKKMYKEELPVAKFIKNNTPKDSIFFSSQDNSALIDIYGDRDYYEQIQVDHLLNKSEFEKIINDELQPLSQDVNIITQFEATKTIDILKDKQVIQKKVTQIQPQINKLIKAEYKSGTSVYFLYSYRKLDRLNNAKVDTQCVIDSLNKDAYKKFGYKIVYSDKNVILLKLR